MIRFIYATLFSLLLSTPLLAQNFNELFRDSTLRIDYIFSGDVNKQDISLSELCMEPAWYGKRQRLSELPVEGNGQIIVRRHGKDDIIYINSFSTLFQEWLTYDEATTTRKSFENVFLVPMPKDTVDITVQLRNNRREIMAQFTHTVTPDDILIRHIGFKNVTPYETIHKADNAGKCIHVAFLAEGYREEEMPMFINDAKKATDALFKHEPFKTMKGRFNIIAVKAPSLESGTSEPSKGIWKNTVLHSNFDTFYSGRYLTTLNVRDVHDQLAGTPYEHIIILVNTPEYGGGGILNSYNLSMTHHPMFEPVVVHEFGHSFAGLADEYAYENEPIPMYPHDIEPWERNITTLKNFNGKWEGMIKKDTPVPTPADRKGNDVGVYEGAGYSLNGVYRGSKDCRMRSNNVPYFCPVCRKAIADLIDFYTK